MTLWPELVAAELETRTPQTRPRVATHYCDWDAPGKHTVPALCGIYIPRRAHANAPTCPDCRRLLAAREQGDR